MHNVENDHCTCSFCLQTRLTSRLLSGINNMVAFLPTEPEWFSYINTKENDSYCSQKKSLIKAKFTLIIKSSKLIHDTFKHGIFNLINYLWTKRVTQKKKKVHYVEQNFQNHTKNYLPVMLQEPCTPWKLRQHQSRNKNTTLWMPGWFPSLHFLAEGCGAPSWRLHGGGLEGDLE